MLNRFKNFTVLSSKISRNIRRIKTEEMKDFDLKSPHVSCLYYLYNEGNLTAKELIDICDEDKASVSRSLDYLEKNEYLICESTAKKRYKSRLCLTEKGRIVGEKLSKKIDDILEEAGKGISEEERIVLYKCLNIINDNLSKIVSK